MDMMKEIKQRGFSSKVFLVALSLVVVAGVLLHSAEAMIQENSKSIIRTTAVLLLWIDSGDENFISILF